MNTDIAAQQALDRLAKVGFEMLSAHEKVLAAVWTFEAQVTNRGFAKYFSGAAGDMASYAPAAFQAIGAPRKAGIAGEANALFGPGGPPGDRTVRREQVQAWGPAARKALAALETQFDGCPEDADALLEAYLNRQG